MIISENFRIIFFNDIADLNFAKNTHKAAQRESARFYYNFIPTTNQDDLSRANGNHKKKEKELVTIRLATYSFVRSVHRADLFMPCSTNSLYNQWFTIAFTRSAAIQFRNPFVDNVGEFFQKWWNRALTILRRASFNFWCLEANTQK